MPLPRLTVRLLVPCALVGAALAAAPAQTATAGPGHPLRLTRPHAHGAAAPATTGASVIDVVVPLHVPAATTRRVAALTHSHLAAAQRRAQVRGLAPAPAQASAVRRWAGSQGFAVTASTPWSVSLRGRADRLAAAFGTGLASTRHAGTSFATPRRAPVVPAALRGVADTVVGLDTRPHWSGRTVYGGGDLQVLNSTPVRGRTAGAGATVATLNLSGWHPTDLTTYRRAAFGTSDVAPAVTNVVVGQGHAAATVREDDFGMETEVALDAEAIAGVAPGAKQRMYFGGNSDADYLGILNRMVADLTDGVPGNDFQTASTSWGTCESNLASNDLTAMRNAITALTAAGATFFAASGDSGAFGCGDGTPEVDFPAAAESAVAVGGTTVTGSAPSYTSSGWSGSGGGCSSRVPAPARQLTLGTPCSGRAVPDIATLADPNPGFWVFDRTDQWLPVGGTSLAAPASAAGLAVVQAHSGLMTLATSFLDLAYQHPSAFSDITTGTNGLYRSSPGYDLVTGLGSPTWTAVEAALTGGPAPVPTGHNEPLLGVNASPDPTEAGLDVPVGETDVESGFLANGEAATGYAASGTSATSCVSATAEPPQATALPGTHGTVQVSLSLETTDPAVPSGCITVQRPVLVDDATPSVPSVTATYVGSTTPTYRFSWGAASDPAPSSGIVIYVATVRDLTTDTTRAQFFTTGRAYPYADNSPFKAVAGHAYSLEVDALDAAFNDGWRGTSFVAPYDDSKASLSRHPSGSTTVLDWTRTKAASDFLGSHLVTGRAGAWYAVTFTGKTLTAGVLKGRYGGYADVYVDGVKRSRISHFASSTRYRQAVRLATFSSSGTHKVLVKVVGAHPSGALGNLVYLDSLTVG